MIEPTFLLFDLVASLYLPDFHANILPKILEVFKLIGLCEQCACRSSSTDYYGDDGTDYECHAKVELAPTAAPQTTTAATEATTVVPAQTTTAATEATVTTTAATTTTKTCVYLMQRGVAEFYYQDRQCAALTVCGADQYQAVAPTVSSDRQCAAIRQCIKLTEYQSQAATPTSDRVCQTISAVCNQTRVAAGKEYEAQAPNATSNRICSPVTVCTSDQFQSKMSVRLCCLVSSSIVFFFSISSSPPPPSLRVCACMHVCARVLLLKFGHVCLCRGYHHNCSLRTEALSDIAIYISLMASPFLWCVVCLTLHCTTRHYTTGPRLRPTESAFQSQHHATNLTKETTSYCGQQMPQVTECASRRYNAAQPRTNLCLWVLPLTAYAR